MDISLPSLELGVLRNTVGKRKEKSLSGNTRGTDHHRLILASESICRPCILYHNSKGSGKAVARGTEKLVLSSPALHGVFLSKVVF